MSVIIYEQSDPRREIVVLCEDSFDLSAQLSALESWIRQNGCDLDPGDYVADVDIVARTDFSSGVGGGAAFSPDVMKIMGEKGIWLFISEYPQSDEG